MRGTFLVVDDEKSLRLTFETFLRNAGHAATSVASYDEAIAHFDARQGCDVIFSDILLGERTGIDLLRELRRRGMNAPVIMVTGAPNMETAVEAIRLGAFDYLAKPVTKDVLLRTAERALEFKRLRDENEHFQAVIEGIFRSVGEAIVTVDRDGGVVAFNDAAETLCDLSADQIGQPADAVPVGAVPALQTLLHSTLRDRRRGSVTRLEVSFRSNQACVVSATSTPLILPSGEFAGAVLVLRDETRLNELERTLKGRRQLHSMVGKSAKMQDVYALIEDLADVPSTVLVTGESGTGKELVADALHYMGTRHNGPLVKVNCAALTDTLLESELFGHVRGAFTGAVQARVGRFQKADGGTIFLDEIGDISPRMQTRLLRVLQEKQIERVGDSTPIDVDVRVVAATNQNLLAKVRRGEIREDLYYRLKVVTVELPPLRERRDDIPLLIEHFRQQLNRELNRSVERISDDVLDLFMEYSWPGNVRELKHALEHALIRCRQAEVFLEHLPAELRRGRETMLATSGENEEVTIRAALRRVGGNRVKAARLLGIDRKTLYRKLEKYHIVIGEVVDY
ncbi:MAG: sigma 54-interacting transcriptional regulator [Desulfuromonadales bacterium]|nr:sigma 54-interacting transcriptional regulator [Desulfuromonadales bacterium]